MVTFSDGCDSAGVGAASDSSGGFSKLHALTRFLSCRFIVSRRGFVVCVMKEVEEPISWRAFIAFYLLCDPSRF